MQTFSEQSALGMNSMISSIVRVIGFPNAHAILLKTAELFMVNSGVYAIFSASFHFSPDGTEDPPMGGDLPPGNIFNFSVRQLVPDHVRLDSFFQPPQLIEISKTFEGLFGEVKNVLSFFNPFIQGFLP